MKGIVNVASKIEKKIIICFVATIIICFSATASFASFSMGVNESGIYGGTKYDITKIEVFDLSGNRAFQSPYAGNFSAGSWTSQAPNANYVLAANISSGTNNFSWTLYFTGNENGAKLDLAYLAYTNTGEVYGTYLTRKGNAAAWTHTTITGLNVSDARFDRTGAPVPVPPAIWLLGSGLMGIVGLRRKFDK